MRRSSLTVGMMMTGQGGMVRLSLATGSVEGGKVTSVATNVGALIYELLIMPMPADGPGTRLVDTDGKVDESVRLGEASISCGLGTGDCVPPRSRSLTTVALQAGDYKLLGDVPWHYADRTFAPFHVS